MNLDTSRPRTGFAKNHAFVDDELRDRELALTLDVVMAARGYTRDPETGRWLP